MYAGVFRGRCWSTTLVHGKGAPLSVSSPSSSFFRFHLKTSTWRRCLYYSSSLVYATKALPRPIPFHIIPCHPIQSHPTPSHLTPFHTIPYYPIPYPVYGMPTFVQPFPRARRDNPRRLGYSPPPSLRTAFTGPSRPSVRCPLHLPATLNPVRCPAFVHTHAIKRCVMLHRGSDGVELRRCALGRRAGGGGVGTEDRDGFSCCRWIANVLHAKNTRRETDIRSLHMRDTHVQRDKEEIHAERDLYTQREINTF